VLHALKWASLVGAAVCLALNLAGFTIDVSNHPLQIALGVCMVVLVLGAALAHFPGDTRAEGATLETGPGAWRYVPLWLRVPPFAFGTYFALGMLIQAPGVRDFSLEDLTPTLARWACAGFGIFYSLAAGLYDGAARIRAKEFL
jgi:hypothetical protein